MPMLQKNMTIISSLVSLGTLVIVRNCSGYEAFMHLLLQDTRSSSCSWYSEALITATGIGTQL
jgi:biopolymer transport protein ExbB